MKTRRSWAWPLVPVYGAALAAKDALRAIGLSGEQRLRWPVLSVGGVSAGGAGKTPVAIALSRLLLQRGWEIDILSRGYGRRGRAVAQVDVSAKDAADRFGDEPVLIAERTGAPVWVGASRHAAGQSAERQADSRRDQQPASDLPSEAAYKGPVRAHILDDGFQHRALFRDFNLVVVTARDLRDTLLPAGNLREPLTALRRADAFVVREEELDQVAASLRRLGRPEVPVWTLRRTLQFPQPLGVFGAGLRPLAFCGLARPESFATMLTEAGCGLVDTVLFPDHHRYTEQDLALLVSTARQLQATGLITTEKDAVKLSPAMRARLETEVGLLMIVPLEAHFVYESPVVRTLEERLRKSRKTPQQVEAGMR